MAERPAVQDWATDYDIFDPDYVRDPYPIWEDLRQHCPVAHTDRWAGSWMPIRYEDLQAIAKDVVHFSSDEVTVAPVQRAEDGVKAPPITSDPPEHTWARRLILPSFAPRAVDAHEDYTRELARSLIAKFIDKGEADAAVDYAQQIPPRVIGHMLGVPEEMTDEFVEWVRGVLELGLTDPELRMGYRTKIINYFKEQVADRKRNPRDDMITALVQTEVDGKPVPDEHIIGTCNLLLIAGIDTTWSSIGSALWHLGQHPDDRRRLADEPELIPTAVEELLRAYSPVTMARVVTEDLTYAGQELKAGDRVLMNFPAANRDPAVFERADEVVIDRQHNRHIAFGAGIHRCAGSNLARLEMNVALEEWLAAIPEYELAEPRAVTWAGGQVRGPRTLPVAFPPGGGR
jgi:cytochrome P450